MGTLKLSLRVARFAQPLLSYVGIVVNMVLPAKPKPLSNYEIKATPELKRVYGAFKDNERRRRERRRSA